MRTHEIESWALNVVERVNAGRPIEDQRVELKGAWIEPYKAARQIAAIANAAHGGPVLWLIGVDENTGVTGASMVDLANWYPQVESQFDGLAPNVTPLNVPVAGNTVVALLFETERAPLVVKVLGTDRLEVPWRGSTSTRSARREELLRILSPLQRLPALDVMGAAVEVGAVGEEKIQVWKAAVKVFATVQEGHRVVIPFHRCKGELEFPRQNFKHPFARVEIQTQARSSPTITWSATEAVISGSGTFTLYGELTIPETHFRPGGDAHVSFAIYAADVNQPAVIDLVVPIVITKRYRWEWGDAPAVVHKLMV